MLARNCRSRSQLCAEAEGLEPFRPSVFSVQGDRSAVRSGSRVVPPCGRTVQRRTRDTEVNSRQPARSPSPRTAAVVGTPRHSPNHWPICSGGIPAPPATSYQEMIGSCRHGGPFFPSIALQGHARGVPNVVEDAPMRDALLDASRKRAALDR
jgi:hypothetical protein